MFLLEANPSRAAFVTLAQLAHMQDCWGGLTITSEQGDIMGSERLARRRQLYEWRCVPAAELERLVWSMPSTEVAARYGVSDRAVGKRCQQLGIAKPPRGYWARLRSGRGEDSRG